MNGVASDKAGIIANAECAGHVRKKTVLCRVVYCEALCTFDELEWYDASRASMDAIGDVS